MNARTAKMVYVKSFTDTCTCDSLCTGCDKCSKSSETALKGNALCPGLAEPESNSPGGDLLASLYGTNFLTVPSECGVTGAYGGSAGRTRWCCLELPCGSATGEASGRYEWRVQALGLASCPIGGGLPCEKFGVPTACHELFR